MNDIIFIWWGWICGSNHQTVSEGNMRVARGGRKSFRFIDDCWL